MINVGKVIGKTIEFVWKPQCTEHSPVYSMISTQCTEHPPVYCTDMQSDLFEEAIHC